MLCNFDGFAKKERQCDVMLLSKQSITIGCGTVMFSEKMKFKLIQKNKPPIDTVVFFVLCPYDYGNKFWSNNSTYHISFQEDTSSIISSTLIDNLNGNDKKYKVKGLVTKAKKYLSF